MILIRLYALPVTENRTMAIIINSMGLVYTSTVQAPERMGKLTHPQDAQTNAHHSKLTKRDLILWGLVGHLKRGNMEQRTEKSSGFLFARQQNA